MKIEVCEHRDLTETTLELKSKPMRRYMQDQYVEEYRVYVCDECGTLLAT